MQNLINNATDFISDVAEGVSEAPGKIMDVGNNLNDDLINFADDLDQKKQQTADTVRSNFRDNKVKGSGMDAANWLSNPMNIGMVVLAIVGILIAVRNS